MVNLKEWYAKVKEQGEKVKEKDPELGAWIETHADAIIDWYEVNNREMTATDLARLMSANMKENPTWLKEST